MLWTVFHAQINLMLRSHPSITFSPHRSSSSRNSNDNNIVRRLGALPRHHPPLGVELLDLPLGLVEHGPADVVPEGGVELGVVGLCGGGGCISQAVLFRFDDENAR